MLHFLPPDPYCVDVPLNYCHQICFSQFGCVSDYEQAIVTGYLQSAEQVAFLGSFYNPLIFLVAFAFPIIQHSS